MAQEFTLRSRKFLGRLGWGALIGLLSAVGVFIFIALMNLGIRLVWPNPPGWSIFIIAVSIAIIWSLTVHERDIIEMQR